MVEHITAVWEDPGLNITAGGCVYHDSHCDYAALGTGCTPLLQCLGQLRDFEFPWSGEMNISFGAE